MKTTKLIATALILSIVTLGFAQAQTKSAGTPPTDQSIVIQLKKAMQSLDLTAAMKRQLDPRFLYDVKPFYTVAVNHKHKRLYICGTYDEWRRFFSNTPDGGQLECGASRIPLTSAVKNPHMLSVLRAQVNPSILRNPQKFITVHIKYRNDVLYIIGSYNQWKDFFKVRPLDDPAKA